MQLKYKSNKKFNLWLKTHSFFKLKYSTFTDI